MAALGRAVERHLGARGVRVEPASGGAWRVTSADSRWIARPVTWLTSVAATLVELSELPELTSARSPRPVIALLPGGGSQLLTTEPGFAAFAEMVGGEAQADELAHLIAHFWGRGMERVLPSADALSEAGLQALRGASADPAPPRRVLAGGGWELRFLAAAAAGARGGQVAYDLREWTVRRLDGDGVEWQVRPLALGVVGALRQRGTGDDRGHR
jgi:hypothetical protein